MKRFVLNWLGEETVARFWKRVSEWLLAFMAQANASTTHQQLAPTGEGWQNRCTDDMFCLVMKARSCVEPQDTD